MKFSEQWLREWVNPQITSEKLAEQLTMAGLEVDAMEPVAPELNNVVVGQVVSLEPHPNADKLNVCQVDVGEETPLNIVCGASNVAAGGIYPVAKIGAELPGGFKIKKAKLRGVESFGMLCSAKEIELSDQAEGLLPLAADAPVGSTLSEYLRFEDQSIELGLTPNRADCLSISGVAREVGVINQTEVTPPEIAESKASLKDELPVDIQVPDHCPRYVGRIIKGINPHVATPMWMQEKLRRCGLRSISPVVDITNYVLVELGQPMHAFDLSKLNKGIVVRLAKDKEKLTLLDGQEISLNKDTLVIADHSQAQALAGIMGGMDSAVSDDTKNIFLESAFFSPQQIAGKARSYSLHTDSSHRFERGVDPQLQRLAIEHATRLLIEIVGGEAGPIVDVKFEDKLPKTSSIKLRANRLEKVLGVTIDAKIVTDILQRLDMQVEVLDDGWQVMPPSFRFDMEQEIDLIEDIARIYGYNNIPSQKPIASATMVPIPEQQLSLGDMQGVLVERGYQEAITYSFVDPNIQKLINPETKSIQLANPIASDMSDMRTSLWTGLLQAALHNLNRQQENVRLFESGLRFLSENDDINQEPMLAGLCTGQVYPEQWGVESRETDFYDVKITVESLLKLSGQADRFIFIQDRHLALHPGQTARIVRKVEDSQEFVGWIGAIHPAVAQKLGISKPLFLFELRLNAIIYREIPRFREVSKFPAIRRDLAIVVDENTTAQTVNDLIRSATSDYLTNLQLFDEYRGKGIDSGRKSLAYSLTLQKQDKTLTDEEVETVLSGLMAVLNKKLGATLRE